MSCHALNIHFLLVVLLSDCGMAQPASPSSSSLQLQALLALKQEWQDPLGHLSDWNASPSSHGPGPLPPSNSSVYCDWTGVTCANSSVVSLSLAADRLLGGTLSESVSLLSSLEVLSLPGNRLIGPIPDQVGSLSQLRVLDLSFNGFTGNMPSSLAKLSHLRKLDLSSNKLTGILPSQLGSSLEDLRLRNNLLTGTISSSLISSVSSLRFLLLEQNKISGVIPPSVGRLSNLIYLAVDNNSLSGKIPSNLGNIRRLSAIYLSSNQLRGSIPPQLGNLTRLVYLHLDQNLLTGGIPSSLGSLSQLLELDLQQNNLSGSIPSSLGNFSALRTLNVSYNNLSGEVPINGALAGVPASAYSGNPFLCGGPLPKCTTNVLARNSTNSRGRSGSLGLSNKWKVIIEAVVGGLGLMIITAGLAVFLICWRARKHETVQIQNRFSPDLSGNLRKAKLEMYMRGFKYSYQEIVSHAGYYDTAHVLGKGRFATVYRSDLRTPLAVKVFNNPVVQPVFEKEIDSLAAASHVSTLLQIRGYYSNPAEKVIFYDFMPHGTLYHLLHESGNLATSTSSMSARDPVLLDWTRRLNIAMGVAQGLAHLHRGSSTRMLHKDLKSTNVLLDENFAPMVADYGLVGVVTRAYVETPGYASPELRATKKYSEKTDVYCYGVVLLELLTRKKPVSYIGERELNLVTWVLRLNKDGRAQEVFDRQVVETCAYPDYPERALKLAVLCLSEQPAARPSMSEVASILEGMGASNSPVLSPPPDLPLLVTGK